MNSQTSEVFIEKNLILESGETGQINTVFMKLQYYASKREVSISRALRELQSSGFKVQNCQIFFMDVQKRVYVYLGNFPSKDQITLEYQYIMDDVIRLRYSKINQAMDEQPKDDAAEKKQKKKKVKERTIKEAIDSVQKWRQVYNETDEKGKRIHTLESAAEVVGVAKKTLDDYYANIRVAESYGFDFQTNMNQKIGVLRKFVRVHQKINKRSQMLEKEWDTDLFWASSDSDDDIHKL